MMKRIGKVLCVLAVFFAFCMVSRNQSFAQVTIKEEIVENDRGAIKYPQFQGIGKDYVQRKINMDVKVLVGKFVDENKKDKYNKQISVDYKVHYMDEKKVSFEIEMYAYNGGAHGMTVLNGYTYNLENGGLYSFAQLFDFRPSEINQRIFAYAKANDIFLFSDFRGIKAYPQNFYLNENGKPVILFQQYEIAPYSSGILRIEM